MIITRKPGVYRPNRRFGTPKFQKGILHPVGFWHAAGGAPVITVTGASASHSVANGNTARAGFRVNVAGTIEKLEGTAFTQVNNSTDWIIPNQNGAGYYVQFTKNILDSAPNYDPDTTVLGTWYQLNTVSRRVGWEESTDDTENGGTLTIKISDDASGSPVLDQANHPCTAIVGVPL